MIDIAGAVRAVAELAAKEKKTVERIEARDRVYIANQASGEVKEVDPRREDTAAHLEDVKVVRLRSVLDWARAFPPEVIGEVRLSRKGESSAVAQEEAARE